jgi:predicted secreted protein
MNAAQRLRNAYGERGPGQRNSGKSTQGSERPANPLRARIYERFRRVFHSLRSVANKANDRATVLNRQSEKAEGNAGRAHEGVARHKKIRGAIHSRIRCAALK